MGLPAAGKSTVAERLAADGYARVNRDEKGGSLDSLLPVLDTLLASGTNRVVLDNTYVTRKSRAAVLGVAARHGVPVRCLWLSTSVEDAQVNAVTRIVSKYGRLLDPDEMRTASRSDVSVFPPSVQFRYQRELEPPQESEGFSRIDVVPFVRLPAGSEDPAAIRGSRTRPDLMPCGAGSSRPRRQAARSSSGAMASCSEAARATGRR